MFAVWAVGYEGVGEEVKELRSTNRWLQNNHESVKYRIGHGVAKELTCMTHGHEQWCGDGLKGVGDAGGGWLRGRIGTTVIAESVKLKIKL